MLTLEIDPADSKRPFVGADGETYWCNACLKYSPDFTPSSVKSRDRRCRSCLSNKRFERMQSIGHLQRLKLKLCQNLIYQKRKPHARAVTCETVMKILSAYDVKENDWSLVKTIKVCLDPIHKTWIAQPVFYNLSRLAKD